MAADEDPANDPPPVPDTPPDPPRDPRHIIRSIPLLCGCVLAVGLELLVLFGARPTLLWHILAVTALIVGAVLGWLDTRRVDREDHANRIALLSLVGTVLGLVVALLTYFVPLTSPG